MTVARGGNRTVERPGISSARITRAQLVAPPEFRGHAPAGNEAARVGGARIELVNRNGTTHLGGCYQQIPVRLMPPFVLDDEPAALLYLINLTAGLLDGDGHLIQLIARAGSRTVVTSQSATRVHPALSSYASQQWSVEVEDDACLVVLPGPTIPYRGSRYYQRARVALAPRARLIWGDLWLAGRYERGAQSERFVFERIVQDLEARRAGRLVYRDRFCWDGPWSQADADWYFGGGLAAGSLFVAGPLPYLALEATPGLAHSAFPLESGESCMRWCGDPAAVTAALVGTAMRVAASWSDPPGNRPWLLSSHGLAPNHWFSSRLD